MRHPNGSSSSSSSRNGAIQQVCISSENGVIRPPVTPAVPMFPTQASPPRDAAPVMNRNGYYGVNGDQDAKMVYDNVPHAPTPSQPGGTHVQSDGSTPTIPLSSPMRSKSQTPATTAVPNGFTVPSI